MKPIAAAAGIFIGMAAVIVVLLVLGLHRLDSIASSASRRSSVNVEVVCEAINKGRAYSRAHIPHYQLRALPCKELVKKTIAASR